MEQVSAMLLGTQIVLTFFMAFYLRKNAKTVSKPKLPDDCAGIGKLRRIKLTKPLTETTRPLSLDGIAGQESGIKALKAALFGANPRHIIIYGPPGCGKTTAARAALEQAKASRGTPFLKDAPFVEIDGAVLRCDERGIADPLMGFVHDPIYQGAGAFGGGGIPRPNPGAVTQAHGGVLFIDEIGELNPRHKAALLKVLEDRRVMLHSAYYSPANTDIPEYIHDIFKNGLPADFRLIGATTKSPEEIPDALRSRCAEVFFTGLSRADLTDIVMNAGNSCGARIAEDIAALAASYAENGRDAVNITQSAVSLARMENRSAIITEDILSAAAMSGRGASHPPAVCFGGRVGAVICAYTRVDGSTALAEIEAVAVKSTFPGSGKTTLTGICKDSADTAFTLLRGYGVNPADYDIHVYTHTARGGLPGQSAAVFAAVYSAVANLLVPGRCVLFGDLTIRGGFVPAVNTEEMRKAAKAAGGLPILPRTADHLLAQVFGIKTRISNVWVE